MSHKMDYSQFDKYQTNLLRNQLNVMARIVLYYDQMRTFTENVKDRAEYAVRYQEKKELFLKTYQKDVLDHPEGKVICDLVSGIKEGEIQWVNQTP